MTPSLRVRLAVTAWAPAVAAAVAWPLTQPHGVAPVRWAAGVLLAFLLPGLAATAALLPGRALSTVERAVLAPALSLAVVVFGGLVLNAFGVRLTAGSWATLTASVTIVCAAIGYLRQWRSTRRGPLPVEPDEDRSAWPARATQRQLVLKLACLVAVVALLVGASWLAMTSALNHQDQTPFTALSIVQAADTVQGDGQRPVDIAVDSHESDITQYVVLVTGAQAGKLSQFSISLVPGQVWKTRVQVPVAEKVSAQLFKGTSTTAVPYRTVFVSGLHS